jgi:uncharacterized membrane protein
MDRMLVVIFNNADKAAEGSRVLRELDDEGYIAVYDAAAIAKSPNGTMTVKRSTEYGPAGTLTGLAVGSLIGLLGGPFGIAVGATSGILIGAVTDLENVRVGTDFIQNAAKELAPGKAALVAEIDEEEITPVDMRMEDLGGHVLRQSLRELKHAQNEQDLATLKAEIAQIKAEHAEARAERKAKLEARLDSLKATLKQKTDQAKSKREALKRQAEAKIEALKVKAAQSKQEIKIKHEQRVARAMKVYNDWINELDTDY